MADKVTKPKPVVFNVGGKHFEVSRTVIDQHEDSMLARLVSETWIENPEQAVFIDRDGFIFAQILNYHGSVSFPRTVWKSDFLRDLEYYAIVREGESVDNVPEEFVRGPPASRKSKKHYDIGQCLLCSIFGDSRSSSPFDVSVYAPTQRERNALLVRRCGDQEYGASASPGCALSSA
jgi:hypothetical protein